MNKPVKVQKIGDELGVTLPEDIQDLGLAEGDELPVVRTETGIELRPTREGSAQTLADAEDFMSRHKKAMTTLAS